MFIKKIIKSQSLQIFKICEGLKFRFEVKKSNLQKLMVQWIKVILEYIENFTGPYNYGTGLPAYEKCRSLWLLDEIVYTG